MWLLGRLSPDFKTIADFRRDNGEGIRNACRQFIVLCRQLNLFAQAIVAIDGSKFKAVNAHDRNFTRGKLEKRMQEIDRCIERYLTEMDTADRQPADIAEARTTRLKEKMATLTARLVQLKEIQAQLDQSPTGQISLTDPDARAMATSTSRGLVGYNVQTAVDTQHHLIVAHEVTNIGSDRRQLAKMARQAKAAIAASDLQVIADRGYYHGDEIHACEEAGIVPDILCVGKALSGGMLPLAATLAKEEIYAAFSDGDPEKALMHGPTFMANALGCAAANASLDLFEKEDRLKQVEVIERAMYDGLRDLANLPGVADVRIKGAIGVVELEGKPDISALRDAFIKEKVWIRPFGNIIYLTPPLVISQAELSRLLQAITKIAIGYSQSRASA